MPSSRTKELARKLGVIGQKRKQSKGNDTNKKRRKDFESTCWEQKKGQQEIIEFPVVLLDLGNGEVLGEFQQFVMPMEHPTLSDFCKKLTGISQEQVDNGVPIKTCLYLFKQWLGEMQQKTSLVMMEPGKEYSEEQQLCAIATWSDWDLGVCLFYECRRKQIRMLSYFSQWVNIRALYKTFYERRPSGLKGSLEDLGIQFTGQEHSGIDDARNTAKLCYRMVRDGCKLNITKNIDNKPISAIKCPITMVSQTRQSALITMVSQTRQSALITNLCEQQTQYLPPTERQPNVTNSAMACNKPAAANYHTSYHIGKPHAPVNSPGNSKHSPLLKSVVSKHCQFDEPALKNSPHTSHQPPREKTYSPIVCQPKGSLHQDYTDISRLNGTPEVTVHHAHTDNLLNSTQVITKPCAVEFCASTKAMQNSTEHTEMARASLNSGGGWDSFSDDLLAKALVEVDNLVSHDNSFPHQRNTEHECAQAEQMNKKPSKPNLVASKSVHSDTPNRMVSHISPVTLLPTVITNKTKNESSVKQSSTPVCIKETPPSECNKTKICQGSYHTNTFRTHPNISVNGSHTSSSHSNVTPNTLLVASGHKVTPPMCDCGRRAKRKLVAKTGPNEGKPFYVCPSSSGSNKTRGCGFFKWEVSQKENSPSFLCSNLLHSYT